MSAADPIARQVIVNRLSAVAAEMQTCLFRTGYSTIIRESQDASCAVLSAEGRVVGQHVVLPLHMGAFPRCVAAVLERYPAASLRPGDAFLINSPYAGGSPHANDIAVVTPAFDGASLLAFCASIAHKSDIGGAVPGSGPADSTDVFQEGLQLPAVRYLSGGAPVDELVRIIAANSRTPELVLGDVAGQAGANAVGATRLGELTARYGAGAVRGAFAHVLAATERRARELLREWPDGEAQCEGHLDGDGVTQGRPVRFHLRARKTGERLELDFSGCDAETAGPANVRPQIVRAACHYAVIALLDPSLPPNDGLTPCVEVITRRGSVADPRFPRPVGNYIMSAQLIAELVIAALTELAPERAIAGSGGDASFAIGWRTQAGLRVHYELLGSAYGASVGRDGASGLSVHITNCRVTPIEVVESEFPVRVRRFELLRDSGGAGRWRGGLGYVREYEVLDGTGTLSVKSDMHGGGGRGIGGGAAGRPGRIVLERPGEDPRELPARLTRVALARGDVLRFERPGGGGCGHPRERDRASLSSDVADGYVTPAAAREHYGAA